METRHTPADPPTLTIGEAARALGVSVDTIRRWADSGKLPVIVLPSGHRRFYTEDVAELLRAAS